MGDHVIDIILFAFVALLFVVQLWKVLGQRTGTERPPQFPPSTNRVPTSPDNVVVMPPRPSAAAPLDPIEAGLADIRIADPGFRPDEFLAGARHAFEIIVHAFGEGDTAKLRPLVADEVFDTFAEAIRGHLSRKETVETRVIRQAEPELVEARMDGRTAMVTVRFTSTQISVTRAADGSVVEGDPSQPIERTDVWTFARNTRSADPNWALVSTAGHE